MWLNEISFYVAPEKIMCNMKKNPQVFDEIWGDFLALVYKEWGRLNPFWDDEHEIWLLFFFSFFWLWMCIYFSICLINCNLLGGWGRVFFCKYPQKPVNKKYMGKNKQTKKNFPGSGFWKSETSQTILMCCKTCFSFCWDNLSVLFLWCIFLVTCQPP